ncbi:hypothetical protein EDM56_08630 [Brevibacillus fluminis]|uniref:G5 domain-containing protein n=1 Tax=Brevibacillus fluminis TaxID=511487 RepID=A0A3M8DR11_9BACL|nr:VanW family protein [Brevibacillus fluminis]RNB90560.1 hypothetical protein EDM56_08630 [Brevibacillus fluminis]
MERSVARMPERSFLFALYLIIVLLSIGLTSLLANPLSALLAPKQLSPAVKVGGLSLGALDADQVKVRLHALLEAAKQKPVRVEYGEKRWTISAQQLGINYDEQGMYEDILYASVNSQGIKKIWNSWTNEPVSTQIPFQFTWNQEAAIETLQQIAKEVDQQPQNAAFSIQGGQIRYTPHQIGRELSVDETVKRMEVAMGTAQPEWTVVLAVKETPPSITGDKLEQITTQLAQASTALPADYKTVQKNLETLVKRLNGTLLASGSMFSFTKKLGPFVTGEDYMTLPTAHPLTETGGVQFGIGQAASTLYEAALRSGLEIRERHSHLQPQSYTTPGLDAAVWDGQLDLKLVNTFSHPVYIDAKIEQNRLFIRLYGSKEDVRQTEVRVENVETFPANTVVLVDGQMHSYEQMDARPGVSGVLAQVFRFTKTDKVPTGTKQELVSKDYYRPIPKVVYIGPPQTQTENGQTGEGTIGTERPADIPLQQTPAEGNVQGQAPSAFENDPNVIPPSP